MIAKEVLVDILKSQMNYLEIQWASTPRDIKLKIETRSDHAIIISGIRRSGKSTLLNQLMKSYKKFHYFNFEEPRLGNFEVNDFNRLDELFQEENPKSDYYFFDEIQNIEGWERYVRLLIDRKKKVFITGSNALLLSYELGTKLTGRNLSYTLFPFSFAEFLKYSGLKRNIESFKEYFEHGGFPEYLSVKNRKLHHELLSNILIRDIIVRHNIRDTRTIQNMAVFLLSNIGKEFSFHKLKQLFNLGSTTTVTNFISYYEDCYLLFTVPKFDYSVKKQLVNPKKIYAIDTGFINSVSISFNSDLGRLLENIVFIELIRRDYTVFYYKTQVECDFVVSFQNKLQYAIQVCYSLNDENFKREMNGIGEAMNELKLTAGYILTYSTTDEYNIDDKKIIVKPVWKWLLESE
jgi:hypothetical protein